MNVNDGSTRRTFIKQTGVIAAAAAATPMFSSLGSTAYAAGSDEIKFVLVGAGGRGRGAADQILGTKGNCKLVAVADAFGDAAQKAVQNLKKKYNEKVTVDNSTIFEGLDGYKKAIDSGCDLVVLATPPGFRPQQFEYAVKQGKHVFMEKPVATDAPGVRRVLAAVEESKKKNLMVGVGLQRRHENKYTEMIKRVHDGEIGEVQLSRVYWNGGGIWYRDRRPGMTEMQYQVHNWYHFIWPCGDQICEQHIHNIDVGCWAKNAYPVECNGMGGRENRYGGDRTKSQIFDHTFCEFTFADGSKMFSQGRHLENSWTNVSEHITGTKGSAGAGWLKADGKDDWRYRGGEGRGGHDQEQHDLIEALMAGKIYNEGEYGAKSTFAAILGREACYTGKIIKWDELLAKGKNYAPDIDNYTWESTPPAMPDAKGQYPVAVPGKHNPFA